MSSTRSLKKWLGLFLLFSCQQTFSQLVAPSPEIDPADEIFKKVDVQATFPGGNKAWIKYVSDAFDKTDFNNWEHKDQGTCRVRFIVNKNGKISAVQAMNMKDTRLAKLSVAIIEKGPRWLPARYKGKPVNAYREQPITVTLMNTLPGK